MQLKTDIKPKDRDLLIQALRAGVVPRAGIRHVQVGRAKEIVEVNRVLDSIINGGTFFKLTIGVYGSGKTFFIKLTISVAQEKKMATMHADLTPERKLHSSQGHAKSLLTELVRSLATRTKPEGNALEPILQRFINDAREEAAREGSDMITVIKRKLEPILELSGGYDAAEVIKFYAKSDEEGNREAKDAALKWLRAEFSTKTEAREFLPVRDIPDDSSFWDHIKVINGIVKAAGYSGLFVALDELVNLYKIPHAVARTANYEQILRIYNDLLQGEVHGIGLMLGGTPEFLADTRRGLFSYEALRSRLAENSFAGAGLTDLSGPVLRLQNLTPEDMWVLLQLLRAIYLSDQSVTIDVPDEAIQAFMEHCRARIGAAYFQTPRATIRAFLDLLEVLRQNPEATWKTVLPRVQIAADRPAPDTSEPADDRPQSAAPAARPSVSRTPAEKVVSSPKSANDTALAYRPSNPDRFAKAISSQESPAEDLLNFAFMSSPDQEKAEHHKGGQGVEPQQSEAPAGRQTPANDLIERAKAAAAAEASGGMLDHLGFPIPQIDPNGDIAIDGGDKDDDLESFSL